MQRAPETRAISNTYTIGTDITRASPALEAFARAQGWWRGNAPFDFAAAVTSPTNPGLAVARARCDRSSTRLAQDTGHLTPTHLMAALRDHGAAPAADWHPQDTVGATVCMHAADGTRRG